MKKIISILCCCASVICMSSCKENYSNGEKVGNLIEFTKKGVFWDSWEGRLNMTQTGMNTSGEPFSFSFDNDRHDQDSLINLMKHAQVEGWKLKIRYHEVWGLRNCFYNRGETDYFVDDVTVLDKDFANPLRNIGSQTRKCGGHRMGGHRQIGSVATHEKVVAPLGGQGPSADLGFWKC